MASKMHDLARRFAEITEMKKALKARVAEADQDLFEISEQLLTLMIEDGVPQVCVTHEGDKVTVSPRTRVTVKPTGTRLEVVGALEAEGMHEMVNFNTTTLASYFRELRDAGEEAPASLLATLEVGEVTKLGATRTSQ